MDSRERLLTAIHNQRPDRLPAQVHSWMQYYLDTFLGGCDAFEAYERFGLDHVHYVGPELIWSDRELACWQRDYCDLGVDADGNRRWEETISTPKGTLHHAGAFNKFTPWETEPLIKTADDFELFAEFAPAPVALDATPVVAMQRRVGRRGILRGGAWGFGQVAPWQDFCVLVGTQEAILWAMDDPGFVHHALAAILKKRLRYIELLKGVPLDLVEVGGGAGSNTVISPRLFREFLLPVDQIQIAALHDAGMRVVYHLCGGLMKMLDLVVETGADGLETMTPPEMGGDCDLAEAARRVGDRLFFVGGLDQNRCFENGSPEVVREYVGRLHACRPQGGYICSPSDHFFFGSPENIQAFADAARECAYS